MVREDISKGILNALFHTSGTTGITPKVEMAQLVEKGVSEKGVDAAMYMFAFTRDGYKQDGENRKKLDEQKALVDASTWFYTVNGTQQKYEYTDPETEEKRTIYFSGWTISQRTEQRNYFPENAYLGLFTVMPDEHGNNYTEPVYSGDGIRTTYMRLNLLEGIISGEESINRAYVDESTGETVLDSCENISGPEVLGTSWGTILGFGIFDAEELETGDTPRLWGRFEAPIVTSVKHFVTIPAGSFRFTLPSLLSSAVGKVILDGLFALKGKTPVSFDGGVYLGLLTKLPKETGEAYEDGTYFSELSYPTYTRRRLDENSRITKKPILSGAEAGEPGYVDEDKAIPVSIKNDSEIAFYQTTENASIVGFGLFRSADTASRDKPFLWGSVVSADDANQTTIDLDAGETPVIRSGCFEIFFM